jgi:hypothetical protein
MSWRTVIGLKGFSVGRAVRTAYAPLSLLRCGPASASMHWRSPTYRSPCCGHGPAATSCVGARHNVARPCAVVRPVSRDIESRQRTTWPRPRSNAATKRRDSESPYRLSSVATSVWQFVLDCRTPITPTLETSFLGCASTEPAAGVPACGVALPPPSGPRVHRFRCPAGKYSAG